MLKKYLLVFFVSLGSLSSLASDWPFWRGSDMDGIAKGEKWNPESIKTEVKVLWKGDMGAGYSMVAVKDSKVYTTGNKDDNDIIYCFEEKTGKKLWEYSFKCKGGGGYPGPRSSPVIKDGLVFGFGRDGDLVCVESEKGTLKWAKNLQKECGAKNLEWSFASSPSFDGDMVMVNAGEHGMAFDMKTGKSLWENKGGVGNYSSVVPFGYKGKRFVAVFGKSDFYVLNALDGSEVDKVSWKTKYEINAADPLVLDEGSKIFITSGYGHGCALLKFDGKSLGKEWENTNMCSHFSSSVAIGKYIYGVDGNAGGGRLVCLDVATGSLKWKENLGFGALVAADDKIIFLHEKGEIFIFKADTSGYKEIARAKSGLGATCWNMPVLSNGRLYCRNEKGQFVCIDVSK